MDIKLCYIISLVCTSFGTGYSECCMYQTLVLLELLVSTAKTHLTVVFV